VTRPCWQFAVSMRCATSAGLVRDRDKMALLTLIFYDLRNKVT
jgi:hypothetical protein